ncbi:MAG: hypothetical protein ACU0A6_13270 [Shimia sp.]
MNTTRTPNCQAQTSSSPAALDHSKAVAPQALGVAQAAGLSLLGI